MRTAYIALGSNLDSTHGTRAQTLSAAAMRLKSLGRVTKQSSLYETEPVGFRDQAKFLNAVVALETEMDPLPLLRGLLAIERAMGRDRSTTVLKGPRTLDLDLLVMEDCVVTSEELSLPHPSLTQRRFVLAPLVEIVPLLEMPGSGKIIAGLLAELPDEGDNRAAAVRKLSLVW